MKDSIRETVESVVIAFVLAFLFRTFEAEAFVIPTGSMATTLRGQHKDLKCSNCRFPYLVSASEEEPNEEEAQFLKTRQQIANFQSEHEVVGCVCPNCGFEMDFDNGATSPPKSFKGDRILVGKFAYEFNDPKRWDVAVFHFPLGAHQNYIKRLCGLPNETVVIHRGDLLTTVEDLREKVLNAEQIDRMLREHTLSLQRKPPDKVQAMLQVVYDNDFAHPEAPQRWQPAAGTAMAWESSDDGRSFETDGIAADGDGLALLVYEHRMPSPDIWDLKPADRKVPAQLITDYYGYNMGTIRSPRRSGPDYGECWVSDLALDCQVDIRGGTGELVLGLVEADCLFECRLNVENGDAEFSSSADRDFKPSVKTGVRGPGRHRLQFANVDDQLLLWVDGKSVPFDGQFDSLARHYPGPRDLQPARFGSNGVAVRVNHLRVLRDVYYRAASARHHDNEDYGERYLNLVDDRDLNRVDRSDWRFDPYEREGEAALDPRTEARWKKLFGNAPAVEFRLGPDEFMMLGDNSPRSSDSRLWSATEHFVRRDLLIGKALYIYWPHALNHLPRTDIWFPFFPDFGRMGLVR